MAMNLALLRPLDPSLRGQGKELGYQAAEKYLGVLRWAQGRSVEIIEINPFMLRLSKHEHLFSAVCSTSLEKISRCYVL